MNPFARAKSLFLQLIPHKSFARNVGVLAGGTALAQGIGVLALPIITRLYTPENFSILAIFSSIVVMVSVAAGLRYEVAIPLPEKDEDAANLFALAMGCCTIVSALCAIALWAFGDALIAAVNQPDLRPYVWMLPVGIWLSGLYSAIEFWSTRKKRFPAIARTRLSQALSSVMAQIGCGISGTLGATGLLLGQLISFAVGLFKLGTCSWPRDESARNSIGRTGVKQVAKTYSHFPKYSTFEAIANNAAIQLPIIIIGAVALKSEVGYLILAIKAAAIPLGLIGSSISQVYISQAALEHREGRLASFTLAILDKLMKIGVGPMIFIGAVSPTMVPLIFGEVWGRAGVMITWMTPWFLMQFLVSPISMALHVAGQQKLAMANQIIGLFLRVGLTGLGAAVAVEFIFEFYAISGFLAYFVYLLFLLNVVGIKKTDLLRKLACRMLYILPWAVLGIGFLLLDRHFH